MMVNRLVKYIGMATLLLGIGSCIGTCYSNEIKKAGKTSANYVLNAGDNLIEKTKQYVNDESLDEKLE